MLVYQRVASFVSDFQVGNTSSHRRRTLTAPRLELVQTWGMDGYGFVSCGGFQISLQLSFEVPYFKIFWRILYMSAHMHMLGP